MKHTDKVRAMVAKARAPKKRALLGPTSIKCPHCTAKPGTDCLNWFGQVRKPHDDRMAAYWTQIRENARKSTT